MGEKEQQNVHLRCAKVERLKPLGTEVPAGDWMCGLEARTQPG